MKEVSEERFVDSRELTDSGGRNGFLDANACKKRVSVSFGAKRFAQGEQIWDYMGNP